MSVTGPLDFLIQWHLTERCNLRCSHCYQTGRSPEELGTDEALDLIDEAREMFESWSAEYDLDLKPGFTVTGGEPLRRKDLIPILRAIREKGFDVSLLTNGTLVDQATAASLADLGVTSAQVSIEGPEAIHDSIRGRGSFAASVRGVRYLVDCGIPVTLNATLSTLNASVLKDLVTLASAIGAPRVGFSRLVPSGRGAGMLGNMLSKDEMRSLYQDLLSGNHAGVEVVTGDPVAAVMSSPGPSRTADTDQATAGCAAGLSGLTVLADGTITPCRRLPIPLGNVLTDSLREIWSTSEVLEDLRDRSSYTGACRSCSRWTVCRGCRAIAYAWSQAHGGDDFLGDDPQCFFPGERHGG